MQRIDRTWHDKIDYTLSTPSKGVILGTTIDANFRITPLLKGLKIGQVTTSLVETQDLWMDPKYPERKKGTVKRQVAKDKFDFPQDQETELVDGSDAWVFSRRITLPKSLRQCLQTVDTLGFRTKHNLNIIVHLLNPDGHVSKVLLPGIAYTTLASLTLIQAIGKPSFTNLHIPCSLDE